MKKVFAAITVSFALIIVVGLNNQASAQNFGAVWEAVVDYDIDFLSMRSGPATTYSEVTRIPPGARIKVNTRRGYKPSRKSAFEEVSYQGVLGYASSRYFTIVSEPQWY